MKQYLRIRKRENSKERSKRDLIKTISRSNKYEEHGLCKCFKNCLNPRQVKEKKTKIQNA